MKHLMIVFIAASVFVGCKSKPEQPAKPATTTAPEQPPPEADPVVEEEPPPPPATPLSAVDRTCTEDTDCALTTLVAEGERLCCTGCEPHAVSSKWLADSIRTCTGNNQSKSVKCPPQDCEPTEFKGAKCVDGTCQPSTEAPSGPVGGGFK